MTPQIEAFKTFWDHAYSKTPPVGEALRESFPDIWFRIHSLPQAKRYADNERERIEILQRHNALMSDLFARAEKVILIATDYSQEQRPADTFFRPTSLDRDLEYFLTICVDEDPPIYWHFFMTEMEWREGSIDDLLKPITNDEIRNVMLFHPEKAWVYHPYDGGGDVFVKDREKRESMKSKFSVWTSQHPLGL